MQASGFQNRGAAVQLAQHGNLLLEVGRMDDAAAVLMEGLAIAEPAGDDRIASALNVGMVKVHLANGAFEPARDYLAAAEAYVHEGEPKPLVYGIETQRAKLHRLTGQLDAAARGIDELLANMGYPEARRGSNLNQALAEGVEIHRESGNYERAGELVNGLVERLEEQMRPGSEASILLGRALVQRAGLHIDSGDRAAAAADLESALPHLDYALGEDHEETQEVRRLLASAQQFEPN